MSLAVLTPRKREVIRREIQQALRYLTACNKFDPKRAQITRRKIGNGYSATMKLEGYLNRN